jgi:hypothetical protein
MRAVGHKAVTDRIQVDVKDIVPRIYDIQFSKILTFLTPKTCPEENLQKVRSLAKRSRALTPAQEPPDLLRSLNQWFTKEHSLLFLLRVGPRAEPKAKELAADVIHFLQSKHVRVLWTFSPSTISDSQPSMVKVLQCLIFQALRSDPSLLNPSELNINSFQSNETQSEWTNLLYKIFSGVSNCYLIIETHDLFRENRDNIEWSTEFLQIFQNLVDRAVQSGNSLKILVLSFNTPLATIQNGLGKGNRMTSLIQRPVPVPRHLRRAVSYGRRNTTWQCSHPRF